MSTRTLITTIAVIAAFLAFPVIASAVPVYDPIAVSASAQPSTPAAPAPSDAGGTDAITVVLVGGLTLLLGAAAGFEGARVMQRRGRAVQA